MKKLMILALSLITIFAFTACNGNENSTSSDNPSPSFAQDNPTSSTDSGRTDGDETSGDKTESKILIAYFTNPEPDDVDAVARASRVVVNGEVIGNTEFIAKVIQHEVGGDLFQIETAQKYPARPELMEIGQNEKNQNARPELAAQLENAGDYDVIFIGYPNWNADMPMVVYTFLEAYDFSGKTIIPFCPHGGSGFSGTIRSIAGLQPNATVITDGFTVSRDDVPNSESDIITWVKELTW